MSIPEPGVAAPQTDQEGDPDRLSLGVAARLSRYLQVLIQARKMDKETISSQELAAYTHINSTQIRRDLSGFGKFGKRGVGYRVEFLVGEIRKILRTSGQHNIALFGGDIGGIPVRSFSDLERVVDDQEVVVGVIAVPAGAAQEVADKLAESGVK